MCPLVAPGQVRDNVKGAGIGMDWIQRQIIIQYYARSLAMHSKMVPYGIVRFECQLIIQYPEQGGPRPSNLLSAQGSYHLLYAPSPNPS